MISPPARSNTDPKFNNSNPTNLNSTDSPSPCGGIPRGNSNLTLIQNTDFSVTFKETINHPGRFIIQFSPNGDQGFWQPANQLGMNIDTQSNATHTMTVRVPNTTCDNCTIRLLQQMDDQAGEFYVHCIDVRIVAANSGATPSPISNENGSKQSGSAAQEELPKMGGCGSVHAAPPEGGGTGMSLFLLIPFMMTFYLRRKPIPIKVGSR